MTGPVHAEQAAPLDGIGEAGFFLRRHRDVLAIILVGLLARLAVLLLYLGTHGWKGEVWEYEVIATNLLEGRGFTIDYNNATFRSFIVPVFPLLCAFLHAVGGPGLGLFYVFHLTVAAGILSLTYTIAGQAFGRRPAVLAALLAALEPGLIVYGSYKVDVIPFASLLVLLGLYLFMRLARSGDERFARWLGLVVGLAVLTRPDAVGLIAVVPAWLLIERRRILEVLRPAVTVMLVALLVVAPWFVRNCAIHGRCVPLTTVAGEWFWRGNNPNATGTSVASDMRSQFDVAPREFQQTILAAGEVEQDELFRREALRYIADHPAASLGLALKKFYYFWWFTPSYGTRHYDWLPSLLVKAYKALYFALSVLMATGLWAVMRSGGPAARLGWTLLSVPVLVALIHSLNYVEGRHRVLVMPILLIFAAAGVAKLCEPGAREPVPSDERGGRPLP